MPGPCSPGEKVTASRAADSLTWIISATSCAATVLCIVTTFFGMRTMIPGMAAVACVVSGDYAIAGVLSLMGRELTDSLGYTEQSLLNCYACWRRGGDEGGELFRIGHAAIDGSASARLR